MSNFEPPAQVYVVDDDDCVLQAVESTLRAAGYSVLGFDCADSFLRHLQHSRPACLLLDIDLPGLNGLDLQQELRRIAPTLPIVFITGTRDVRVSVQAMKNGALDLLCKPFDSQQLLSAMQVASVEASTLWRESEQRVARARVYERLTRREREVLRGVVAGKPNKLIAEELGISVVTVKIHRGQVMRKTEVESLVELVRFADEIGLAAADAQSYQSISSPRRVATADH